ncbi:DMT family transporter [Natronincola ferrireducens]|uniref:Transporter family-2 protein n=1 Tax=Natronincola ferrireducens TaxID=393762 RepID=A0A1G9F902_9FIRM|nr:DMT family transporter [Natronincola ferrireducens]SDK84683.1 transporter family-2 protein [Natronincola ferrireducens]
MKTSFMSVATGALIAIMIHMNGTLGNYTNVYFSCFIVHLLATLGGGILILFMKAGGDRRIQYPFYYYLGGILGAIIIILNNFSFKGLGVSITAALVFFGQIMMSILVDSFGLLQMEKIPFNKRKLPGIFLVAAGVLVIMWT